MTDRERRCRSCTSCKTAKCRKGATNACSACRNPTAKKGCVLRDPCLRYNQGATTEEITSACNTSDNELTLKAQKFSSPNMDSCSSGVDEREQLSQFIDKTVLKPLLEKNLPSTPPRLLEATSIQDTISKIESPNTVVTKPGAHTTRFTPPVDQSWNYDLDNDSVADLFTSQRRESNSYVPTRAASTPARTGQRNTFTSQYQPIDKGKEDETLQKLISTLTEFLIRVHPHHEADINSVLNEMNLVNHSDQSCLNGVFCQVIKRVHGYKIELDVTYQAGMYLDLYKKSINLLDANLDWDNPIIASPLVRFGVDQEAREASRNDPNNLAEHLRGNAKKRKSYLQLHRKPLTTN